MMTSPRMKSIGIVRFDDAPSAVIVSSTLPSTMFRCWSNACSGIKHGGGKVKGSCVVRGEVEHAHARRAERCGGGGVIYMSSAART